ncbi:MAG TPA: haloacid dehalogenase type II [Anaeromyxobacteraceae bacterium]|nr:haloacid dehalogenase type II [Anaeromyxobacteraceae bacterium]
MPRPAAAVFDVIETLFPLAPLRPKLAALGLPDALDLFFTRILRDAFALDASGTFKPFREIAGGALEVLAAQHGLAPDRAGLDAVLDAFGTLEPHPDVRPAFELLRARGVTVATLSNGGVATTRGLLDRCGLLPLVARVMGVDEIRRYKPAKDIYLHAARTMGLAPGRVAMVAVHAWDLEGARRAGLVTAWASRLERRYHPAMEPPDISADDLVGVAEALSSLD